METGQWFGLAALALLAAAGLWLMLKRPVAARDMSGDGLLIVIAAAAMLGLGIWMMHQPNREPMDVDSAEALYNPTFR